MVSFRNLGDGVSEARKEEYSQQKQFREIMKNINKILQIRNVPPFKIALYHPDKETITVANIVDVEGFTIRIQYNKPLNKYKIDSNIGLEGTFYYERLVSFLSQIVKFNYKNRCF